MSNSASTSNVESPAENKSSSSLSISEQIERDSASISDVVAFSLCSLCSIRLNHLYPEPYHDSFRAATLKRLVEHFRLPQKVEHSIQEFVTDDEFTFLSSIKRNHQEKTFKIIEELVLLSIHSGSYDARMHYLIINVAELLGIPRDLVEIHCESIYELLLKAQSEELSKGEDDKYREKRDTRKKIKKYLVIGLASLGGGAVIGVTGGLAAPIVASAFGAALGAGTVVMSTAAAGVVGSLFGVAGAGLTASKMNKRIGDLEEFSFQSLSPENDQTSLTITIAISGWITDETEQQFSKPWRNLAHTKEQYCLRYESKYLLELSQAMDYLLSFVVSYAAQEALKYTFLAGVMAAIAWPTALISMANILDNPWDVCIGRSAEAGKHLADVLMSRQQGKRPVSLIGFSLGARVIFFCLQELAQRKNSEGIVCDVVLLGAPVTASLDQWKPLGRVISGRIINGYSSSDWLLRFLYRTTSAALRVAGLQELCWQQDKRVKNVDLTHLVGGHMDYYKKLAEILDYVGVRTVPIKTTADDDLSTGCCIIKTSEDLTTTTLAATRTHTSNSLIDDSTATLSSDSAIERTVSESTNLSTSFSQQSLSSCRRQAQSIIDPSNDSAAAAAAASAAGASNCATTPSSMAIFAPTSSVECGNDLAQAQQQRSIAPEELHNGFSGECVVQLQASRRSAAAAAANDYDEGDDDDMRTKRTTTTTTKSNEMPALVRCRPISSLDRRRRSQAGSRANGMAQRSGEGVVDDAVMPGQLRVAASLHRIRPGSI